MAGVFRYHKAARQDFMDAVSWYEEQRTGSGLEFAQDFADSLQKINTYADTYRKVFKDFRKIKFFTFPYYIIYKESKKTIYILAIYHKKRLKHWEKRA